MYYVKYFYTPFVTCRNLSARKRQGDIRTRDMNVHIRYGRAGLDLASTRASGR
jgi:hypothetical protein